MLNRRDFIKNVLRGLAFVSIASGAGFLIFRKEKEEEKEGCNFDFVCKKCNKLNSCSLKQGLEFKKEN